MLPLLAALIAGTATSILSAIAVGAALGLPRDVLISLAPKSVTAPVAMSLSHQLGGIPALTAVLVVITGVLGAVIVTPLMNAMACATMRRAALPPVSPRTASARRAPSWSIRSPAPSPGSPWGSSAIRASLLIPVIVRLLFRGVSLSVSRFPGSAKVRPAAWMCANPAIGGSARSSRCVAGGRARGPPGGGSRR